jgi:hypothetical protein
MRTLDPRPTLGFATTPRQSSALERRSRKWRRPWRRRRRSLRRFGIVLKVCFRLGVRWESETDCLRSNTGKTEVFSAQIEVLQKDLQPWAAKIAEKQAAIDLAANERDLLTEKSEGVKVAIEEAETTLAKLATDGKTKVRFGRRKVVFGCLHGFLSERSSCCSHRREGGGRGTGRCRSGSTRCGSFLSRSALFTSSLC